MQEKWFNCKVLDKFTKNKLFGGRKYYLIISIENAPAQELRVTESTYYSDIGQIKMYSLDGENWNSIKPIE